MPLSVRQNRLVGALSDLDFERWSPRLEPVDLMAEQELHAAGSSPQHAFFPGTATVSLLQRRARGASVEVASVGREGVVGLPIFMGGGGADHTAVVRSPGRAYRVDAGWLEAECRTIDAVRALLLRYVRALLMQIAQTALCNRHHNVGQQVCRHLLWDLDRVDGNRLQLTHEQIAKGLGVRRSGVTEFALRLRELGVIHYRQGTVTVLDRRSLEQRVCECYLEVEQEFERLFAAAALTGR